MAVAVIDVLEVIKVADDHGDRATVLRGLLAKLLEAGHQRRTIQQPGERIKQRCLTVVELSARQV
jgi:hypothetical protein